ncbi:MAG: hypothetical protein ACYDCL_06040 [Myxococcales bacterium]
MAGFARQAASRRSRPAFCTAKLTPAYSIVKASDAQAVSSPVAHGIAKASLPVSSFSGLRGKSARPPPGW